MKENYNRKWFRIEIGTFYQSNINAIMTLNDKDISDSEMGRS